VFYSSPGNLIMPGNARVMGDGWETSRRRDDGNDWVEVALAAPGRILLAELDTTHFKGNSPGEGSLTAGTVQLLPRTGLQPDTRHRFPVAARDEVDRVRLDIFPDGGMARLRLWGRPGPEAVRRLVTRWHDALPGDQAAAGPPVEAVVAELSAAWR
jgi:allantoicase